MAPRHRPTGAGQSLIRLAQAAPESFPEVYRAYSEHILRFFGRKVLVAEDAFDLHSELFAIAFERRGQFRGSTAAEDAGWLYAIARNLIAQYWRSGAVEVSAMQRLQMTRIELDDRSIQRIEELSELASIAPLLEDALDRLPVEQREAVRLRVIEERTYDEIAQHLGGSNDVARARVSRGLRTLARLIGPAAQTIGEPA